LVEFYSFELDFFVGSGEASSSGSSVASSVEAAGFFFGLLAYIFASSFSSASASSSKSYFDFFFGFLTIFSTFSTSYSCSASVVSTYSVFSVIGYAFFFLFRESLHSFSSSVEPWIALLESTKSKSLTSSFLFFFLYILGPNGPKAYIKSLPSPY
jgi:hypothetical protein